MSTNTSSSLTPESETLFLLMIEELCARLHMPQAEVAAVFATIPMPQDADRRFDSLVVGEVVDLAIGVFTVSDPVQVGLLEVQRRGIVTRLMNRGVAIETVDNAMTAFNRLVLPRLPKKYLAKHMDPKANRRQNGPVRQLLEMMKRTSGSQSASIGNRGGRSKKGRSQ